MEDESQLGFGSFTTQELSRMLFWLMVVGYSLRALEVRLELQSSMDIDSLPSGLVPYK